VTEETWHKVREVVFTFVVLAAILSGFLCSLLGCDVAQASPPDMSTTIRTISCRGPQDTGKMAWWDGLGDPVPFPCSWMVKYVCKDHGADDHGWWFEAAPERRRIP
jgi:hypothetical protein